ncbi:hypothetical protein SAMN04487936_102174 [Halobacillus dabanensis]|uniref:Uncharacterized protein n=1 Tax=Halobacillus dabanensis TaxID=240302 RepID=A0A1I3RFB6_HALDA|nr:hypothetical protein SAMN04487936_102174 [Halobacillus dabanensis]
MKTQGVNEKKCRKCSEVKGLEEFHKNKLGRQGRQPRCKPCQSEYDAEYRSKNPKKVREWSRRSYEKNKDYYRKWRADNRKRENERHYRRRSMLAALPNELNEKELAALQPHRGARERRGRALHLSDCNRSRRDYSREHAPVKKRAQRIKRGSESLSLVRSLQGCL